MKSPIRFIKNSLGMSLTEVMVAVGIAGTLAAVSIPVYKQYAFKSKQAEAKTGLGALHAAMTSFEAEFDQYTTRFDAMGISVNGDLRYRLGFIVDVPPPGNADLAGTGTCIITNTGAAKPACAPGHPQQYTLLQPATAVAMFPLATVNTTTYKAWALGQINGVDIDSWSIDQKGEFFNQMP